MSTPTAIVSEQQLPIIKVDDEHLQIGRNDGSDAPAYEISPGAGFVLDATEYEFRIPPDLNISAPNTTMANFIEY